MELTKIELRLYQEIFYNDITEALIRSDAVCAVLPTGGGKTVVFNQLVADWMATNNGQYIIILAHRKELIEQTAEKYERAFGIVPGIIKSGIRPTLDAKIQVASVQTFSSWLRRKAGKRFGPKSWKISADEFQQWFFDLCENTSHLVIDECHLAKAESYKAVIEVCGGAKVLGLTATPYRLSGLGLLDVFDEMIEGCNIQDLENDGFLVPAKIHINPISGEELEKLGTSNGDYKNEDVFQLMSKGEIVADAVKAYKEHAAGLRCLVFAINVEYSKKIIDQYRKAGIAAAHIDGTTPADERKAIFAAFRSGQILVLSNVGIATTGTDIPQIEAVQLLRPTKSLSLYLQMVGRGSRLHTYGDGMKKQNYVLLDHANNVIEHGVPNRLHNWKRHFGGWKIPKKRMEADTSVLLLELETGRLAVPAKVPAGVAISLIEISEEIHISEITKYVKEHRKTGTMNSVPAWKFVCDMRQKNETPIFDELMIIAALTGGTKTTAKIWAEKYGIEIPEEPPKFLPCPASFSSLTKNILIGMVAEKSHETRSRWTTNEISVTTKDGRTLSDQSAGIAFRAIKRNKELFDRNELIRCGVISKY